MIITSTSWAGRLRPAKSNLSWPRWRAAPRRRRSPPSSWARPNSWPAKSQRLARPCRTQYRPAEKRGPKRKFSRELLRARSLSLQGFYPRSQKLAAKQLRGELGPFFRVAVLRVLSVQTPCPKSRNSKLLNVAYATLARLMLLPPKTERRQAWPKRNSWN